MITTILHKDLKAVLMEPQASGIKEPYFIIHSPQTAENITVILPGNNGHEFNKTYGFFHQHPSVLIYRCIYGQGILVIQKNDEEHNAKEIRVASLHPGVEIEVPSGYGHTIINTGKTYLMTVDNSPSSKARNFKLVEEKHGLAYYVIDKNGEIGFDRNPNYSFHPQINSY